MKLKYISSFVVFIFVFSICVCFLFSIVAQLNCWRLQVFENVNKYPVNSSLTSTNGIVVRGNVQLVQSTYEMLQNYKSSKLITSSGLLKIFVHNLDDYISRSLIKYYSWEPHQLMMLRAVLRKHPELHLLDLGCNLGVFTLTAAAMNRKVVALDSNIENVKRLRKSVLVNHFTDRVHIVYNALSDHHHFVQMAILPDNIGGSVVIYEDAKKNENIVPTWLSINKYLRKKLDVPTVTMNDLIHVIPFNACIIKLDIEGFEYYALKSSHLFFKRIHVPIIMMEWVVTKEATAQAKWIIQYLKNMGYVAYEDMKGSSALKSSFSKWPDDVFFIKTTFI